MSERRSATSASAFAIRASSPALRARSSLASASASRSRSADRNGFVSTLLSVLLMLNVMLGTFNLLPLPPLDGGAVFSIFLPENVGRQVREFQRNGALSMIGLVVAWRVFTVVSDPVFWMVLKLVHPGVAYE